MIVLGGWPEMVFKFSIFYIYLWVGIGKHIVSFFIFMGEVWKTNCRYTMLHVKPIVHHVRCDIHCYRSKLEVKLVLIQFPFLFCCLHFQRFFEGSLAVPSFWRNAHPSIVSSNHLKALFSKGHSNKFLEGHLKTNYRMFSV